MSNIYWPRRPDLCNKDGRDCRKVEDRNYRLFLHGNDIGTIKVTGDHVIVLTCEGLTIEGDHDV